MQAGASRYYGAQMGTVVDNVDPRGLHRVKVKIPGIAEPSTDWAFPLTSGGGSRERGGHVAPDVGADVVVWFHQGDPQGACFYACGWWGEPDAEGDQPGGPETPYDAKNAGADAHLIQTMRIGRIIVAVDERPGKEAFRVYDAKGGFSFQVDLEKKQVALEGLAGLLLKSIGQVTIDGLEVVIKGRRVADTSDHV